MRGGIKWHQACLLVAIFVVRCYAFNQSIYHGFMDVALEFSLLYPGDYYLRLLLEEDDTDENNAEYSAIKKS